MKILRNMFLIGAFVCGTARNVRPVITCGSRDAGFIINTSATLNLNNAQFVDGTLYCNGGSVSSGTDINCSGVTVCTNTNSFTLDGSLTFGDTITLGNNDRLVVAGGTLAPQVVVNGDLEDPSIVQGFGIFSNDIMVHDASALTLRWASPLDVSIFFAQPEEEVEASGSRIKLEQDLTFAAGAFVSGDQNTIINIDGNGYTLSFGGNGAGATTVINDQTWSNAQINLTGPVELGNEESGFVSITFSDSAPTINGHFNTLSFYNNEGYSSVIDNDGFSPIVTDITFTGLLSGSLVGSGDWVLNNVGCEDNSGNSVTIVGGLKAGTIDLFGTGEVTFSAGTNVVLNKDCAPAGAWYFNDHCSVNGGGAILDLSDASMHLKYDNTLFADITLVGVGATSFNNSLGDGYLLALSNVEWVSHSHGSIRITAADVQADGAKVLLPQANSGNLFSAGTVTWQGGSVELLSDVVIANNWKITQDMTINGNGHVLDLTSGSFTLGADTTLTISHAVLTINQTSISDVLSNANSCIVLSDVTVKLAGNIDYSEFDTWFSITGPVTFVTGDYTFYATDSSVIEGVTVYYDTLSNVDRNNLLGFDLLNNGRIVFVQSPLSGPITIEEAGTVYQGRTEYLSATAHNIAGRSIIFDSGNITTYDGRGFSLVFPSTANDTSLLTVTSGTTVITENIVFEGFAPDQMSLGGDLYFGDKTMLRLHEDLVLTHPLWFGSSIIAEGEEIVFDLNGFALIMSDVDARVFLSGANALRFCNGRIVGVSGNQISARQNGSAIIFQDVEIALTNDNACFFGYSEALEDNVNADLIFQGNCIMSGLTGATFTNNSKGDVIIDAGSKLSVMFGVRYEHTSTGVSSFIFADQASCLELVGGSFVSTRVESDPLILTGGVLVVDHKSKIDVGDCGITFGDGETVLDVQIRPSATAIIEGSGTLSYIE